MGMRQLLRPWFVIVVGGVFAHGLVPLTDHVLWDGWWYAADLAGSGDLNVMARLFHEVGRPLDLWFYAPLRWLGADAVTMAKCLGTAAWIASAVCAAAVLGRLARLPRHVAVANGLLMATLPIFDLLGEVALWMNTACVLLFWLSWNLVCGLEERTGWRSIGVRLGCLATFFLSFNLNSNLVMFYAVAAALVGLRWRELPATTMLARGPRVMRRYADFLLLPVVFWLWKTWFTPTSGFYAAGYNQPSLAPARLLAGYQAMATNFVARGLLGFFSSPRWIVVGLLAGCVTAALLASVNGGQKACAPRAKLGLQLAGWGSFLLLAAAFPYVAVGQGLANEGWLSRNCILCPLPVAMIVTGTLCGLNAWVLPGFSSGWLAGTVTIAAIGIGGGMNTYVLYQALGAKGWSVRMNLGGIIRKSSPVVIQLRDYFPVASTISYYPNVIWSFLANDEMSSPRCFVIETAILAPDVFQPGQDGQPQRVIPTASLTAKSLDDAITATTMPYALERVPRRGPQLLAVLEPGQPGVPSADIGWRYLTLSWFDRAGRAEFVRALTRIETADLPPIE